MFSEVCRLGKPGVRFVERFGPYGIVVNGALRARGRVSRWAVVNCEEEWVDSVWGCRDEALSRVWVLYWDEVERQQEEAVSYG